MAPVTDGRVRSLRVATGAFVLAALLAGAGHAAPGDPDESFGSGGTAVTGPGVWLRAAARQSDGKIVVGGGMDDQFVSLRFDSDGTLDPSYGTAGVTITPVALPTTGIHALAVQPDDKIVAVGNFALARYDANGALDPTFDGDGLRAASGWAIALQDDGRIVVAGGSGVLPSVSAFMTVRRFDPDGAVDASFAGGAVAIDAGPLSDHAHAVAVQGDGSIVIAGQSFTNEWNSDWVLARLGPTGVLDAGFGAGGIVRTTVDLPGIGSGHDDSVYGLAILPDGRIVAVGGLGAGHLPSTFVVARYLTDGSLDPSFGESGLVFHEISVRQWGQALSTALQPDGKLLVGGGLIGVFDSRRYVAVARLEDDGSLDGSFGAAGIATAGASLGGKPRGVADALVLEPDGGVVTAGHDWPATASPQVTGVLARFEGGDVLACTPAPEDDCIPPGDPSRAMLRIKNRTRDKSDQTQWQSGDHGPLTPDDLGRPDETDDYVLCLYDGGGLRLSLAAPAGGLCRGRRCWKRSPGGDRILYKDGAGTPNGLTTLKARADGSQSTFKLKAKGENLPSLEAMPFDLPVRVQLQRAGFCTEATYATPTINTAEEFRAVAR